MLDPKAINVRLAALPTLVAALLTAACSGEPPVVTAPEPGVETGLELQPAPTRRAAPDNSAAERRMARLQSVASRAEAASGIAEAELALQSLGGNEATAEIRKLTEDASKEFENEN